MRSGRPGGNPDIAKHGFKKGKGKKIDPRINLKGAPRKLPMLETLMSELLGVKDGQALSDSEIGLVVKAAIGTAKDKKNRNQAAMVKEILDRAFGKARQTIDIKSDAPITWNETKTYDKPQVNTKPQK